ncbi:hypothetical protein LUV35_12075 [Vibrio cholerae]|uniref:lipopolysaccharide biosynthesis protein n=1 Tax=Vibrio cholerae TaxID=666 RepID=UPI001E5BE86E|nr:hypothetical protein [Vibrio cholerae]MCD9211716.1 hypothetical protein [Vibrio cholerae]
MLKKLFGMSGALALSQLINFTAISYGSTLFGADEFGRYSYVNSLSLVISVLFYLKADNVILIEQKEEISKTLKFLKTYSFFVLCFFICSMSLLSIFVHDHEMIVLTFSGILLGYFNSKFIVFGSALIKEDKISRYSVTTVVRPFLMLLGIHVATYIPKLLYPMVIIRLFSEFSSVISRRINLPKEKDQRIKIKDTILDKKDFYIYGSVASFLNSLSQQLPMLALPIIYDYESIAYFSLAFALTVAPMTLFLTPLRSLLLNNLSSSIKKKDVIYRFTVILIIPSIFIILSFNLFSEFIIFYFWGEEWKLTSEYMSWISFWVATGFLSSPSYSYMIYSARQKVLVNLENIFLFLKFILVVSIKIFGFEIYDVVLVFVFLGVVYNIILMIFSFKAISNEVI